MSGAPEGSELLEAQGAVRASRPYREVIVSARAR